jgi:lysophospholipase L1-like esterase
MKTRLLGAAALAAVAGVAACTPPGTPPTTTTSTTSTSTTTTAPAPPPAPVAPTRSTYGGVAHDYTGTGPKVAIVGDSLTVLAWNDLYTDLDQDHAVRVAAWFGEGFDGGAFSTKTGVYFAGAVDAEYAPTDPDVAVLALGTNTVWEGGDLDAALTNEAAAVAQYGTACKVWVTIPVNPGAADWDSAGAQTLNEAASSWADETVDWDAAVTADPSLLTAGHVHTTTHGTEVRAQMIADAVRACPVADTVKG